MKKFIAIGHWNDSQNTICIASTANSMKDFRSDCYGNAFTPWVIISEKKFEAIRKAFKSPYGMEVFEEVKKLTTNYRKWNEITDYIESCFDIMEAKMNAAQ